MFLHIVMVCHGGCMGQKMAACEAATHSHWCIWCDSYGPWVQNHPDFHVEKTKKNLETRRSCSSWPYGLKTDGGHVWFHKSNHLPFQPVWSDWIWSYSHLPFQPTVKPMGMGRPLQDLAPGFAFRRNFMWKARATRIPKGGTVSDHFLSIYLYIHPSIHPSIYSFIYLLFLVPSIHQSSVSICI